jgi:thioesterase domain-containing protein/aryl carrier-like protein
MIWRDLLGIDQIDVHDNFFELGGHSLLAVRLISQVEKLTGKRLTLASILHAPTIEEQAKLLLENERMTHRPYLVPIQPEGSRRPLFCIHAHDGNVLFWKELSHRLGPDQPFYGISARGLDARLAPDDRLEDMASRYVGEIKSFQPEGPYFLGGHCMGGVVAFEMAQQLHAQGDQVALLALIDSFAPNQESLGSTLSIGNKINQSIQLIRLHTTNLLLLPNGEKRRYLQTRSNRLLYKIYMAVGVPWVSTARVRRNILNAGIQAMKNYKPKVYQGPVSLFRAAELPAGFNRDPQMGWAKLAGGGVETHLIPGYFSQIVYEPRVRVLAEKLRNCLDRARADGLH